MDETFDKILNLYVPNYKRCLTPLSIRSLKELFILINNSQMDRETKRQYKACWDNTIYNIQKHFGFYEDDINVNEKVIIKMK